MVVALGPGRFYGSVLPRPRFHPDGKPFDENRVDPPAPVMDPLIQWACEARWSMGGLSFDRRRLQGRIEGSVVRLRSQQELQQKKKEEQPRTSPSRDSAVGDKETVRVTCASRDSAAGVDKKKNAQRSSDISSESESEMEENDVKKNVSTCRARECSPVEREKELVALKTKFLEEAKMNRENWKRRAACMSRDLAGIAASSSPPEMVVKRRRVRKLGNEFDWIAAEEGRQQSEGSVGIEEIAAESVKIL